MTDLEAALAREGYTQSEIAWLCGTDVLTCPLIGGWPSVKSIGCWYKRGKGKGLWAQPAGYRSTVMSAAAPRARPLSWKT